MPRESPSSSRGPPPPFPSPFDSRYRAFHVEPTSSPSAHAATAAAVGRNSRTWAVSGRVTPNRVAPLPARRARQMFFVADYDAVCAIMTTSLSLSRSHRRSHFFLSLSFLHISPLRSMYPGAFLSLVGFFLSFSLSFFLSHSAIFSCLVDDEDKLCSCLSRRRLGHAKRRLSSFSFSLRVSCGTYTHRILELSFSHLLLYIFSFISLSFTFHCLYRVANV